jgi:ABC-type nitrate/sulfonate/bicarbonate transport system ATPase subunit
MGKEMVHVDVTMEYGDLLVLDNVKFDVYENEFLTIVGPTGCGKTTMANLIAGLIKPTRGKVTINGQIVNPKIHNISFVFQEPSCIPWRTLWDDIYIGLEIKGVDKNQTQKRIKDVIKLVGLEGFESYFPRQISGGMKQRVAIARAYVTDPDLMLMDEPFGHLDAQTRYLMQIEVMRIWEKLRKTVVFITNNIEEAVYLAERVLVFSKLPARIKGELKIDLPRPRDNTDSKFLKIRSDITKMCEIVE